MRSRFPRVLGIACSGGVLVALLAGCTSTVSKDAVAASIKEQLGKQNVQADAVTCPADLVAEVGQSVRCQFEVGGQPVDAIAKVSSVDGGTAKFDITTEARPITRDLLATKVGEQVTQQAGLKVDSSTCAGDLAPTVGATQTCTVMSAGRPVNLKITVSKVDGGLINYSIEQA